MSSVAVADFNGDGRPDLAAANNGANTVAVLLGNGDGTFQAAQPFATNSPTSVVAGRLQSGRQGRSRRGVVSCGDLVGILRLGAPRQRRRDVPDRRRLLPPASRAWAIAAGDFNGDGAPDLTVTNTFSTTVSVLLNAGDGTFPATPNYRVGRNPESIVVADFNQDGRLDQAVANAGSNTVSILRGNGDGTFQTALTFDAGRGPTSVAMGDFNRDGKLDLVVSNYGNADYYAPASFVATTVSVLLGNGDGTFQAPQPFEAGSGPNAVVVGDFNNDGLQDLAVADYGIYPATGEYRVAVARATAMGPSERRRPSPRATARSASSSAISIAITSRIWPSATTWTTTCRCCSAMDSGPFSPRACSP